ncbi:unnamed protein product [Ambrosiozyma monospora]|uniref:Unnamed protein product n=1 Tax=Ambrosiozyma monospora TaxID=43982 RepID=A0A9W7DC20_AMBMO|nr:unnamed protein product [Ambrosiozyma monospora]
MLARWGLRPMKSFSHIKHASVLEKQMAEKAKENAEYMEKATAEEQCGPNVAAVPENDAPVSGSRAQV